MYNFNPKPGLSHKRFIDLVKKLDDLRKLDHPRELIENLNNLVIKLNRLHHPLLQLDQLASMAGLPLTHLHGDFPLTAQLDDLTEQLFKLLETTETILTELSQP